MSDLDWPGAFVLGCSIGAFGFFLYLVARRHEGAPTLSQIERLRLEPGDVLVVTVPGPIHASDAERLKLSVEKYLPGCKAMVMQEGIKISVLSPADAMVETAAASGISKVEGRTN